jgi:acetyl esterase/lipase
LEVRPAQALVGHLVRAIDRQHGRLSVGEISRTYGYALRLMQAGVSTELHVYPGAYHGWEIFVPTASVSQRMIAERFEVLKRFLHR